MNPFDTDVISLAYQLLPGFISAWIFYSLTAHPMPSTFHYVIQALIFTVLTQFFVIIFRNSCFVLGSVVSIGTWDANSDFTSSVVFSVCVGFVFTAFANTGIFHSRIVPDWVSTRTSYPSEWYSAFNRGHCFVYLHLKDGRRIYGWPREWPDQPDVGHFILEMPEWILDSNERAPLLLTEKFLVPASDVELVEFEKNVLESSDAHSKAVQLLVGLRNDENNEK